LDELSAGAKNDVEMTDSPGAPGVVETPVVTPVVVTHLAQNALLVEKQQGRKEIAAAALLRKELAKVNPFAAAVTSFLNVVRGGEREARKKGERLSKATTTGARDVEEVTVLPPAPSFIEPLASTPSANIPVPVEKVKTSDEEVEKVGAENVAESEPGDVATNEEVPMDESSVEGSRSTSGSSSGSSCSSFSTVSRKRPTEKSLERKPVESSHQPFPRVVRQSAAGCRVYLPSTAADDDNEIPGRNHIQEGATVIVLESANVTVLESTTTNAPASATTRAPESAITNVPESAITNAPVSAVMNATIPIGAGLPVRATVTASMCAIVETTAIVKADTHAVGTSTTL